jgi:hypothetical protein
MAVVHSVVEELGEYPLLLEALLRGRRRLPCGLVDCQWYKNALSISIDDDKCSFSNI